MKRLFISIILTCACAAALAQFDDLAFVSSLMDSQPDQLPVTTNLAADYDVDALSLNDGDAVTSLTDKSSNGFHLLSTSTNAPIWTNSVSVVNGNGFLQFDGTDDWMTCATIGSNVQPITIYMVVKTVASADATSYCYFDSTNFPTPDLPLYFYTYNGSHWLSAGSYINAANISSRWHIVTIVVNTSASYVYTNNVAYFNGSVGANALVGLTVGANRAKGWCAPISLARMAVYRDAHSSGTRSNIVSYLNQKYAVY